MRLDWIFLPRENPCAKFCIIIIIIIINCHLYFGRRRILIPESSEKIPSSRVELNSQPSEF